MFCSKNELLRLLSSLGISIKENNSRFSMVRAIRDHYLNELGIENFPLKNFYSHMLPFQFNSLSLNKKADILNSSDWIAEKKFYGSRVFVSSSKKHGVQVFSRKCNEFFIPEDITKRLCDNILDNFRSDEDFILDGILVSDINSKLKLDTYSGSEDNLVSFVLGLEQKESKSIQERVLKFSIVIFDILSLNGSSLVDVSLVERRRVLDALKNRLSKKGDSFILPTQETEKVKYFENCISKGYSGVVLKNIHSRYILTSYRDKNSWVKLKNNCNHFHNDLDVFISGVYKNRVVFSIYYENDSNIVEQIFVGTSEIPEELEQFSEDFMYFDIYGEKVLHPSVFGKVVRATSKGFDPETRKFSGFRVFWKSGFRSDKNRFDCYLTQEDVGIGFCKKHL
jgi:ATP-dependent DNA ligase